MPSHLFSPFRLRGLDLANRIVVSPMAQYSAENGCANKSHLMHLGNMSISGAGLLIIEATAVERDGRLSPGDLGLWCDENEAALEPVVAFCRKHGAARIGLQLQHAGRKGSVTLAWRSSSRSRETRAAGRCTAPIPSLTRAARRRPRSTSR